MTLNDRVNLEITERGALAIAVMPIDRLRGVMPLDPNDVANVCQRCGEESDWARTKRERYEMQRTVS